LGATKCRDALDIGTDQESIVFTQPELTTGSNAYRANAVALPRPLPVRRDGYLERTVITSDGVRLAVRDYGAAGPREHTVVLLHGLCLTQSSWALQVRELVRGWGDRVRIITYDHRGHGRSTGADMRTYRIDRLAADLADVLTALRVTGPLTLAGHSMGG
jgi:alpha-beta hydrolase superfamily lysophospholipase